MCSIIPNIYIVTLVPLFSSLPYSLLMSPVLSSPVPEEAAALRELVEDLRSALQGSDARCLALEVALRQERARNALDYTCSTSTDFTPLSTAPHSNSPCIVGNVTSENSAKVSLASQGRRRGVGGEVTRTGTDRHRQ